MLVRATVGVEAHTHEFIATAHEDQKFGFSVAGGDAFEACRRVLNHSSLDLVGVHSHIGSQIFDTSGFEVSAHRAVALLARLRDELGATPPYLDLGGGFGIAYTAADTPMDVPALAASMRAIVGQGVRGGRAGRAAARGGAGTGHRRAGLDHPVRGGHGQGHPAPPVRLGGRRDERQHPHRPVRRAVHLRARVPGQRGAAGAVPGGRQALRERRHRGPGHLAAGRPGARATCVAVAATGAYCRSLASNYNHQPRPPVVAVGGGAARVVVRRETVEDLLRLDVP